MTAAATDPPPPPPPEDTPLVLIATQGLESIAIANQVIRDNVVSDIGMTRTTKIDASYTGSIGIHQINQDAGVASNQANMLLLTLGAGAGNVFSDQSFHVAGIVTGNTITVDGGARSNVIQNSFANAQGYFQVNQNSGVANAQLNIGMVSVGAGLGDSALQMTDSTLGSVVSGNTYNDAKTTPKADVVSNSFDGFRGVMQITQSSGDGNAITNGVTIGVTVLNVK